MSKEKQKESDSVLNSPIVDPNDESSGMILSDKEKDDLKALKPGTEKWISFADFLDKSNKSDLDQDKKKDEAKWIHPSTYGNIGGRHPRKFSYKSGSGLSGKRTIGSEDSEKSAYAQDPTLALDVKMFKEKLSAEQIEKINQWIEKNDDGRGKLSIEKIIEKAIDKDWSPKELLEKLGL